MNTTDTAYRVGEPLLWREFDGQWVVYQPLAGGLCAPDALSAAVLSLLEDAPQTGESLELHLVRSTGLELSPELHDRLQSSLAELRHHGLIDSAPTGASGP